MQHLLRGQAKSFMWKLMMMKKLSEHHNLWRAVISMLAADEAVEGESGPSVPEAVIPLGWHQPVRTMSRRWRRNLLRVSNGP